MIATPFVCMCGRIEEMFVCLRISIVRPYVPYTRNRNHFTIPLVTQTNCTAATGKRMTKQSKKKILFAVDEHTSNTHVAPFYTDAHENHQHGRRTEWKKRNEKEMKEEEETMPQTQSSYTQQNECQMYGNRKPIPRHTIHIDKTTTLLLDVRACECECANVCVRVWRTKKKKKQKERKNQKIQMCVKMKYKHDSRRATNTSCTQNRVKWREGATEREERTNKKKCGSESQTERVSPILESVAKSTQASTS